MRNARSYLFLFCSIAPSFFASCLVHCIFIPSFPYSRPPRRGSLYTVNHRQPPPPPSPPFLQCAALLHGLIALLSCLLFERPELHSSIVIQSHTSRRLRTSTSSSSSSSRAMTLTRLIPLLLCSAAALASPLRLPQFVRPRLGSPNGHDQPQRVLGSVAGADVASPAKTEASQRKLHGKFLHITGKLHCIIDSSFRLLGFSVSVAAHPLQHCYRRR